MNDATRGASAVVPALGPKPAKRDSRPLFRRPSEVGRWLLGVLAEFLLKAYAAAAALSVALSDAETWGGKIVDAVNVVPNLLARFHEAQYVIDHRERIQSTLEYVHQHAPDPDQLEAAAGQGAATLERLSTTYSEVTQAWDSFVGIRPQNILEKLPEAKEHFDAAWAAKPDLDSVQRLASQAQDVAPFLRQLNGLDVDFAQIYGNLLRVLDNFAADEIVATLGIMAGALLVGSVVSKGAGFWIRRGRPGLLAALMQRWGARRFRDWYVDNLEYALGPSLYAVARERVEDDIVADPRGVLSEHAHEQLERYFRASDRG